MVGLRKEPFHLVASRREEVIRMRIDIKRLKERGYDVHISEKGDMVEIYPQKSTTTLWDFLSKNTDLTVMQREDIVARVNDFDIFNAITS